MDFPGLHRNISADIHLLRKQTRKTQLKYLVCVVVGTKGLNYCGHLAQYTLKEYVKLILCCETHIPVMSEYYYRCLNK